MGNQRLQNVDKDSRNTKTAQRDNFLYHFDLRSKNQKTSSIYEKLLKLDKSIGNFTDMYDFLVPGL